MTYLGANLANGVTKEAPWSSLLTRVADWRRQTQLRRQERRFYRDALNELRSLQPDDLRDLRLDPYDFKDIARVEARRRLERLGAGTGARSAQSS